jgi:hypothetical protein
MLGRRGKVQSIGDTDGLSTWKISTLYQEEWLQNSPSSSGSTNRSLVMYTT